MKPKGGDGMNDKMEQIRRAVKAGKLTADGARKALEDEMERELSQKPEDIDMDVVNACEALLTELSGADEALHTEENRFAIRRQMRAAEKTPRRRPKAAAIAAALAAAVLAFGGTDAGAMQTSRGGIPVCTLSIPCRYVHSALETVDLRDLESAVKLLKAYFEE